VLMGRVVCEFLIFDLANLCDAPRVASTVEPGAKPGANDSGQFIMRCEATRER
jgi:hypothetical protein